MEHGEQIRQALSARLLLGCLYGLMCVGLGLTFGIMRVINFAQGEFMMLAVYAGLNAVALVSSDRAWAFPVAMGVVVIVALRFYGVGAATHYLLVSRVSGARALGSLDGGHNGQLVLMLCLSLMLQNGGLMLFGSSPISNAAADMSWMLDRTDDMTLFFNQARLWSVARWSAPEGIPATKIP